MTTETLQPSKVGKIQNSLLQSPNSRKYAAVRTREYLLVSEIEAMRDALKKAGGCHAHRDSTLILLIYRHGLRVAEAAALRWEQIDWSGGNLHVKRVKQGTASTQPLYGDEIRALRKLQRDYPASPYIFQSSRHGPLAKDTIGGIIERAGELALLPFPVHAHMLRHACGYALAARGVDTRTIQGYLGHNNIGITVPKRENCTLRLKRMIKKGFSDTYFPSLAKDATCQNWSPVSNSRHNHP